MRRSCANKDVTKSKANKNRIGKRSVYHAVGLLFLLAATMAAQQPSSKTFLIIMAHHDDHTWWWGFSGFASKLVEEGWTGYFVRTTNDEKDSNLKLGWGGGDQVNLKEARAAAAHIGLKDVISLNWRNDHMDSVPLKEVRAQYILLLRKFRPDVVMTYNPWGHYDRNPDHRKVGRAIGEALWLSGLANVNPEHAELGLKPYRVPNVYYGQRDDYGLGHTPNFSVKLTDGQLKKKGLAWWAHTNVRGKAPDPPTLPADEYGVEKMFYRGEWDFVPGLKAVLP